MSSGDPIPYAEALPVAEELRELLAPACERIVIAGSLRRRKALVSDVELVAEPRYYDAAEGLFDTVRRSALDAVVATLDRREVRLHRRDGSEEVQTRDGNAYKALAYRGLPVDLFLVRPVECAACGRQPAGEPVADDGRQPQTAARSRACSGCPSCGSESLIGSSWGVILTIRTGPADFSRELVTRCRTWGRRVQGGRLYVYGRYVPCPDERTFLAEVGMPWLEPEERAPERVKLMMGGRP